MGNLTLLVPVLLVALIIRKGEALRCWTCSSDLNPHCKDPFQGGRHDDPNMPLFDCDSSAPTYPHLSSSKAACKKHKKYINGELVISRGCTWKRADDNSTSCPGSSNGLNVVTTSCETCDYDGCNGAAAAVPTEKIASNVNDN